MKKLIFILLFISFVVGGYFFVSNSLKEDRTDTTPKTIVVEKGDSLKTIAATLKNESIIQHDNLFIRYGKKNSLTSNIKFGVHTLSASMSYGEMYQELSKTGKPLKEEVKFTVPEGYTARQIAELLESKKLANKDEFLKLVKEGNFNYWFLKDVPNNVNRLEGFLFPDTYTVFKDATEEEIISKMLDRFNSVANKYINTTTPKGYKFYDIIKMASLVEREAVEKSEQGIIAGVFYNRLEKKMKLESCATVEYLLPKQKAVLSLEDVKIDSPYNTYKYLGLPPTPIANMGEPAIKAAMQPVATKYLFFFAPQGSTSHIFNETYQDHLKTISQYRK